MRTYLFLALFCLLQFSCTTDSPSDFVLGKGTNLAHWLSQSNARGEARENFIQKSDIQYIAQLGFQHVRLPIDEEQMWDENGKRHDDAFQLMFNCIDWCIENNLRVVVDLHILRSHHFNEAEKPLWTDPKAQQQFCDLWTDLSSALKHYPLSMVAYELMNEAVADDHEEWNVLQARCFETIRKVEKNRLIVIGSNRWQSPDTFDALKVPDDKNIILSFHFYNPFLLTHYHASWSSTRIYTGPVHYPGIVISQAEFDALPDDQKGEAQRFVGVECNKETLTKEMAKPIAKAKELGLRLYCGEYGVIDEAPQADRLRWYRDMMAIFDEQGIGSANWNYKSANFGFVFADGSRNEDLINAIIAPKQSFLRTNGHDIVDERGNKVFLRGVGLGNWLLPEGYMWKFGKQGDRPRKMEKIVVDHIGQQNADLFWKAFRKNYITEADIRKIADLGYNSVRPALNSKLFISETEPHEFVDEGFELLDNLIGWCKKYNLYVIIDMHGAPGGQTGQNIDDSPNDLPELFMEDKNQDLLEKLWVRIADRYKDEPAVAAYDLLNEPLPENTGAAEKYKHMLVPLYERLISAIREVDKKHMFTLEGYNWSNNWSEFTRPLDDNMFFQFHYYCWDNPTNLNDISLFLERREQLNTPIWVGETGEKDNTIYFATAQYFDKNNVGWSFWPWKKMDTSNTPYSIKMPEGWEGVREYSQNGEGAIPPNAQKIFDELIENIKIENCEFFPDVVNSMFCRLPLTLEAENYGHDGYQKSYYVKDTQTMSPTYRKREPVQIELIENVSSVTQGQARRRASEQAVKLTEGEWTAYKVNSDNRTQYNVVLRISGSGTLIFSVNGEKSEIKVSGTNWSEVKIDPIRFRVGENELKAEVISGTVKIDRMEIGK